MRAGWFVRGVSVLGALGVTVAGGGCRSTAAPCAAPCETPVAAAPSARPPQAECGEVWCLVETPPVTCEVTRERLVRPETCRPQRVRAVRGTVKDYELAQEARVEYVTIPAEYECVTETYVAREARQEWVCRCRRDACGHPKEMWELRATPAVLATRTKRVLVRPETVQPVWTNAVYRDVDRCVELRPAHENCLWVPPVFDACKETRVVAPASCEWRRNPACEVPVAAPCPPPPCAPPPPPAPPAEAAPAAPAPPEAPPAEAPAPPAAEAPAPPADAGTPPDAPPSGP